jgi:hypothetical protein
MEPPNQIKKEEPKAGTCGLPSRESCTLNPRTIEQKHWTSNRNSQMDILGGYRVRELSFVDCPWWDRFHAPGWGWQHSAWVVGEEGKGNGNE